MTEIPTDHNDETIDPTASSCETDSAPILPDQIGRYRVTKLLGQGGFGRVYLARDEELQRHVAVKVPRADCIPNSDQVDRYLSEARVLASLDHSCIVPVYDAGRGEDGFCFVVSKYIEGTDLATCLGEKRPTHVEAAKIVAAIAEALHHAHVRGLVHRDVKPGNILLDELGKPHLSDFGLALKEQDFGRVRHIAGTPAYMSPEQARGECHRVDGRSDVFSLGLVFYEALTGRRAFRAELPTELLDEICTAEPRPPRQYDDTIPRELERICLKALSKRLADRYTTATDMAADLQHFLESCRARNTKSQVGSEDLENSGFVDTTRPQRESVGAGSGASSSDLLARIVPKGLRSFDTEDSDFILDLLPGPHDRVGLPEAVRFWKTRIESLDLDRTFSAGLVYGPSGCGKSSFVKAALLPRMGTHVTSIYVEAAPAATEARLLRAIRYQFSEIRADADLSQTLAELRRGSGFTAGKKVLLVLDQFEQWLHAHGTEKHTELVQALRHCDGRRVQCLILVRVDFWMAVTRFMAELEVDLVQGQNTAAVDLFTPAHARKVLAAFGRAYETLPERARDLTKEQNVFLDQAIAGLTQQEKVVCVRLALFADMMKGRPWTPTSLKAVGGTEGVGVTFLEEVFSSPSANPKHRFHQKAARAALRALLPKADATIKGSMRSSDELREASGYERQPDDFAALMHILDQELRLVTPTVCEQNTEDEQPGESAQQHYQLTHDYLVPALRRWLFQKQRETARGRMEILLAERAAHWRAKPQRRHLPSTWEWGRIRLQTRKRGWDDAQEQMMKVAGRHHVTRMFMFAAAAIVLSGGLYGVNAWLQARHLVHTLKVASSKDVPRLIEDVKRYGRWATPLLEETVIDGSSPQATLHAALTLVSLDQSNQQQTDFVLQRLLETHCAETTLIRDVLSPQNDGLTQRLWRIAQSPKIDQSQRFRTACLLAQYDPQNPRWDAVADDVVQALVREDTREIAEWSAAFRLVRDALRRPLSTVSVEGGNSRSELNAAIALTQLYADRPDVLVELIVSARPEHLEVVAASLQTHGDAATKLIRAAIQEKVVTQRKDEPRRIAETSARIPPESFRDHLAGLHAKYALSLFMASGDQDYLCDLLAGVSDVRLRTYLIHQLPMAGASPKQIFERFLQETDPMARQALILSLGNCPDHALNDAEKGIVAAEIFRVYRDDDDVAIHSAAEWLLRRWKMDEKLHPPDERVAGVSPNVDQGWYVTKSGHTMAIFSGPSESVMGSLTAEWDRQWDYEERCVRRIDRTFAIATKEVTVSQYMQHAQESKISRFSPELQCPVAYISWYEAARYCRWLSEQEGIPKHEMCYPPIEEIRVGMELPPDYLDRTGYRLPTEAEWEYACRAGTMSRCFYGADRGLLRHYAWYALNARDKSHPVATLMPNQWGMFDVYGNVAEWTQDHFVSRRENRVIPVARDEESTLTMRDGDYRAQRGGSFTVVDADLRTAYRRGVSPSTRYGDVGLRIARTLSTPCLDAFQDRSLNAETAPIQLAGTADEYRLVMKTGDIQTSVEAGGLPSVVDVSSEKPGIREFSYRVTSPGAGHAREFTGMVVAPEWRVDFFSATIGDQNFPGDEVPDWDTIRENGPVQTIVVSSIAFRWGQAAPRTQLSADWFAVEANTEMELPRGEYEVALSSDDVARLFIDDLSVIDQWGTCHLSSDLTVVFLESGIHRFRIEYVEKTHDAVLEFSLRPLSDQSPCFNCQQTMSKRSSETSPAQSK